MLEGTLHTVTYSITPFGAFDASSCLTPLHSTTGWYFTYTKLQQRGVVSVYACLQNADVGITDAVVLYGLQITNGMSVSRFLHSDTLFVCVKNTSNTMAAN